MNNDQLQALYESLRPEGRSAKCPRKGVYKILNVYEGHFCNKFAMMARAVWKYAENDLYNENFVVEIQLESLKRNCRPDRIELLRKSSLEGKELKVHYAINSKVKFLLKWNLINPPKIDLDTLNNLLISGQIPMDSISDDYSPFDDLDFDEINEMDF